MNEQRIAIKVFPREVCLSIARMAYPAVNINEHAMIDFLPDEMFGGDYEVARVTDEGFDVIGNDGCIWSVHKFFVAGIRAVN